MNEKGKRKMSTILVTGATGNLGSKVVREVCDRGQQVRAYTRQSPPSVPAGIEVYPGDILMGSGLREAIRGWTRLFTAPALSSRDMPRICKALAICLRRQERMGPLIWSTCKS
jgi:nucleoside-diphosphate-sugar epimerase